MEPGVQEREGAIVAENGEGSLPSRGLTPMEPGVRKHEVLAFPSNMQWCCRWLAESPIRFLDVGTETTQGVAEGGATFVGSKKLGRPEASFGIGAKIVDEVPQLKAVF